MNIITMALPNALRSTCPRVSVCIAAERSAHEAGNSSSGEVVHPELSSDESTAS